MKRLLLFLPLAACGHQGKMVVDTPIAPYQKPDISEITGIDEDDAEQPAAKPAPVPAAKSTPAPAAAPSPEKK